MNTFSDFQTHIKERFQKLSEQRKDSSVFVLEHGLDSAQIEQMKESLRAEIERHDGNIQSAFKIRNLPLLVVATEVGYQYQGNGKEFWPHLEKAFGLKISLAYNDERAQIREWFEAAHKCFKIAKPLKTAWSEHRSIIAWPITNAILPLDIRLQFMESLAYMPQRYYGSDAGEIVSYLCNTQSKKNTLRYIDWLATMPSVGPLAQAMITNIDESPFFSSDTLQRLRRDMEQDKINGVKLRQLRNRIGENYSDSQKPIIRRKIDSPIQVVYGKLFLTQKENGTWILEGELPEKIVCSLRENDDFKYKLRSGSLQLKAWNVLPIPPARFLHRERLEIESNVWSIVNSPFLQNIEFGDLSKIGFKFDCPLFFQNGKKVKTIESDSGIVDCIVKNYEDGVAGICIDKHSPNGFRILHIDTSNKAALDWCRSKGMIIRAKRHWHWICPSGEIDDVTITVFQGDSLYLAIEENYSVTVKFQKETLENATGVIAFGQLDLGEYSIEVGDENWLVLVSERESTPPLFTADWQGERIIDSLRNQSLKLMVESSHPFVNVDYSVSLSDGSDTPAEYSNKFDSFPFIGRLFRDAFCEKESETKTRFWRLIRSQKDLKLCLEIGNVFKQEWTLESPCFGIWWNDTETDNPVPESDGAEVFAEEILHRTGSDTSYPDGFRLYQAVDRNREPLFHAATVLKLPKKYIPFGARVLKLPDHKLRKTADTKNGVGLASIVEDILAFRRVQSESLFAEMQRKKILDELETVFWTITCDEKWADCVKSVDAIDINDFFAVCVKTLIRANLQWGGKQADKNRKCVSVKFLSDEFLSEKYPLIKETICAIYPKFWMTLAHDTCSIEESLSKSVFEILQPELHRHTNWDNINGYIAANDWDACFKKFTEKIHGRELATLVNPVQVENKLFEAINTHANWSLKSMVELFEKLQLAFLSTNPHQQLWSPDIAKNVLAIFMNPAAFESTQKQETLKVMLSDSQSMRCVSYLCWRKQQIEKIQEAFSNA